MRLVPPPPPPQAPSWKKKKALTTTIPSSLLQPSLLPRLGQGGGAWAGGRLYRHMANE